MSIHDRYAEQRIAAAEHDLVEAHKRIRRLEGMVRDMYAYYRGPVPYTPAEVAAHLYMGDSIDTRIRELGLEADDG